MRTAPCWCTRISQGFVVQKLHAELGKPRAARKACFLHYDKCSRCASAMTQRQRQGLFVCVTLQAFWECFSLHFQTAEVSHDAALTYSSFHASCHDHGCAGGQRRSPFQKWPGRLQHCQCVAAVCRPQGLCFMQAESRNPFSLCRGSGECACIRNDEAVDSVDKC